MEAEHSAKAVRELRDAFERYARGHALKSTAQRELIVDEFLRSRGHVSIEDLLAKVRKKSRRVGYATVYRTMKLLCDAGVAAARQFGDGQTRFEVMGEAEHHDHLICTACGRIFEFENSAIEALQEETARKLGGFKLVRHKLELYGLCPKAAGVPHAECPKP